MTINIMILIGGLVLLTFGATKFVDGAVALAHILKIPSVIIGLTIVALGTSAPEMFVSAMAAIHGKPGIAIGNVMGSNIANILLVLGCGLMVKPISISKSTLKYDLPFVLLVTFLLGGVAIDGYLGRVDGLCFLVFLMIYFALLIRRRKSFDDTQTIGENMACRQAIFWVIVGLFTLLISSHFLVKAAANLASILGLSDVAIGLTVVAVGTSLPEIAAVVISVSKGYADLAVGSVLGSNILNLLAVLPFPAEIHPHRIDIQPFWRDFFMMVFVLILLGLCCLQKNRERIELRRWCGILFLMIYVGYVVFLFQ